MNAYLFSQAALLIPALLAIVISYLFLHNYRRFWRHRRRLIISLVLAVLAWVIEIMITKRLVGLQNTPAVSYVTILVFDFLLILLILFANTGREHWITGSMSVLSVALLSVLVVNNFYQYYPTLSSVFGRKYQDDRTTTYSHDSRTASQTSIEHQLFATGTSRGSVAAVSIPGTLSRLQARSSYIYLPPAYTHKSFAQTKFPVLLLLTGTPGSPSSWLQDNLFVNTMDHFARQHSGITPIIAIVDHSGSFTNDTECLDSSHGNAETYLTADVPNYLISHYRISSGPNNWGIGGFSEGGMCAAMLTLTHQNRFLHFLDMSGDSYPFLDDHNQTLPVLFHDSRSALMQHNINWLLMHQPLDKRLTGQFAIGRNDRRTLIANMRYTYHLAASRHMTSTFELMQNQGHSFGFWSKAYADALPHLSQYLGATD